MRLCNFKLRARVLLLSIMLSGLAFSASAAAATYTVNSNADAADADASDGRCDIDLVAGGDQCTLRAALEEANQAPNRDLVKFDRGVFDGTHPDSTIALSIGSFLPAGSEVAIDAGDCRTSGAHRPCAGVDAGSNPDTLAISADDVMVKGIAFHGAAGAGIRALGADGLVVRNSWFGMRVDGFPDPNSIGVALDPNLSDDTDEAQVGGKKAKHSNVFSGGLSGVFVRGGDANRILGNLFGVTTFGTSLSSISLPIGLSAFGSDDAVGNQIGTKLSSNAARSDQCDGGCNAITNGEIGILLGAGAEDPSMNTRVRSNFIGLTPSGLFSMANSSAGIDLRASHGATIGGGKRNRNYIVGGSYGVDSDVGVSDAVVKGNWIGFSSAGERLDPPDASAGDNCQNVLFSVGEDPTTFDANYIAPSPSAVALCLRGGRAQATRNVIGIAPDGTPLPVQPNSTGIAALGVESRIGKPDRGNTIGNLSGGSGLLVSSGAAGSGEDNRFQANYVGVARDGTAHPIAGDGIALQAEADSNVVGGGSEASENVISNVAGSAILVSALGATPTGNQIKRNRGKDNGTASPFELFVNLRGTTGFGNGDPNLHNGIEAPEVAEVKRRRAEGTALPGAVVYVFETKDAAGASPNRLDHYLAKAVANGVGDWTATFERLRPNRRVTALQLLPSDGSSELALALAP